MACDKHEKIEIDNYTYLQCLKDSFEGSHNYTPNQVKSLCVIFNREKRPKVFSKCIRNALTTNHNYTAKDTLNLCKEINSLTPINPYTKNIIGSKESNPEFELCVKINSKEIKDSDPEIIKVTAEYLCKSGL